MLGRQTAPDAIENVFTLRRTSTGGGIFSALLTPRRSIYAATLRHISAYLAFLHGNVSVGTTARLVVEFRKSAGDFVVTGFLHFSHLLVWVVETRSVY